MIDGHIHFAESLQTERLNLLIEEMQLTAVALQCIPKGGHFSVEQDAMAFKEQSTVPVYVFGGIARDIFEFPKEHLAVALCGEIERLLGLGCDGIKMLEGKPGLRKDYPIPDFDDMVWEGYWEKLEQEQIPIVFHVNDPEEFWDATAVSEFAKAAGWFYDETYINNETQYEQVLAVLERHPQLNIIFPHFLFFSKQLERLGQILDRYPNVNIDITPGVEQYYNLSERIEEAKVFFQTYQNRICYGTDCGAREVMKEETKVLSMEECHGRINLIRGFLESKGDYELRPDGYYVMEGCPSIMHGLGLEEDVLQKIYETNFLDVLNKRKR